jgi:hypothetical protein
MSISKPTEEVELDPVLCEDLLNDLRLSIYMDKCSVKHKEYLWEKRRTELAPKSEDLSPLGFNKKECTTWSRIHRRETYSIPAVSYKLKLQLKEKYMLRKPVWHQETRAQNNAVLRALTHIDHLNGNPVLRNMSIKWWHRTDLRWVLKQIEEKDYTLYDPADREGRLRRSRIKARYKDCVIELQRTFYNRNSKREAFGKVLECLPAAVASREERLERARKKEEEEEKWSSVPPPVQQTGQLSQLLAAKKKKAVRQKKAAEKKKAKVASEPLFAPLPSTKPPGERAQPKQKPRKESEMTEREIELEAMYKKYNLYPVGHPMNKDFE